MLLELLHVLPHVRPAREHRPLRASHATEAPQGHKRGAHPPKASLQQGPAGEQGLQQVGRLPQHSCPLPRRQHLSGVAMARPGSEGPVAMGLEVQGQLGVGDLA